MINARKNKDLIIMIIALGDAYLEKGLYIEAAKRYNQLLDFKVANKHIYTSLSKAYMGMGKYDRDALAIYQKAIQYNPNNTEIYHVLAESFLKDNRDDKAAIQVYELALRHNTPNFDKTAEFLSDVYYRNNDFARCLEITDRLLEKNGYQSRVLNLFMNCSWQEKSFHKTINVLKKLIDKSEDNMSLLKHLCVTYLEKKFEGEVQNQPQRFSFIDRQLIFDHLKAYSKFERLEDLSFYLELKRFLHDKEYWGAFHNISAEELEPVHAYHGEEAGEVAQKNKPAKAGFFDVNREMLPKLKAYEGHAGKSLTPKSSLTFEDFQKSGASLFSQTDIETTNFELPAKAEILLVIKLANYDEVKQQYSPEQLEQVRQKWLAMLSDFLEKYRISSVWCVENGQILFSNEVIVAVSLALDILNKLNRYNFVNEPQEHIHLSLGIHHSRDGFNGNSEQVLRDLSTGLKLATLGEKDLTAQDLLDNRKALNKTNRIFLSAKAYREIKSSNRFKVNSLGQFKFKYLKETLSLHEVAWRNPSDELKFGYIKKISRFELLAELGGRGPIKVYKAKDSNLHRFVILKVIQSEVFNSLPANNPQKSEFYQFAKSLGQLNHPNIVTIYEVDEDHGLTYIAREFVEATAITNMFRQSNPFNMDRFVKAVYQAFKGLQYGHRFGFFHLNLKPNNVMVTSNDEIKLMDFLVPGPLFGSEHQAEADKMYLSPEQMVGNTGDYRSDVFSLGVIMYETLTSRHPFAGGGFSSLSEAVIQKSPVPPSQVNKQIPRFCDALVLRCIEKRPDKRFQSAEQVVNLLKKNFERTLFSNFNFQIAQARDSY